MEPDELAAVIAALEALRRENAPEQPVRQSAWKLAARREAVSDDVL